MKKLLLILLLILIPALSLSARVGHGYVCVYLTNGSVDSIAVDGIYDIEHSRNDLSGHRSTDYVSMFITTSDGRKHSYLLSDIDRVVTPDLLIPISFGGYKGPSKSGVNRIHFGGNFVNNGERRYTKYLWDDNDFVYLDTGEKDAAGRTDTVYMANILRDTRTADSTRARFEVVKVRKAPEQITVYYPGHNSPAYNQVRIATTQQQDTVNSSTHIAWDGDCATVVAHRTGVDNDTVLYYGDNLTHHPAFFTFLTYNKRLPSVRLKSVTVIADKPISGVFNFDTKGIDTANPVESHDTVTLNTTFHNDKNWLHTPRHYETSQDSTAAYMVVAPTSGATRLKMIFSVRDTLSLIDTVYVKEFTLPGGIRPGKFYVAKAEVPDTLFSIVDLGLGDIKFSYRNVEAYFERGPVSYYGGMFSYGESNTKNDYSPGWNLRNYRGGSIRDEFTKDYDVAFQRWGHCWRMMNNYEGDSLLRNCKFRWGEFNGVEGVYVTGPSGKRIFLPANDNCVNYWTVDRSKDIKDYYYLTYYGDYAYYKIPILSVDKNRQTPLYRNATEFYRPGFCRGVLEYSNEIKSNTGFDHSLLLLRHVGEEEVDDTTFAINGIARAVRPWPKATTPLHFDEVGFVFGTDSTTLYCDADKDSLWNDSLFIKTGYRPVDGNHVILSCGAMTVGGTDDMYYVGQEPIVAKLNSSRFLGYLDKKKSYYVREYARIGNDYYYATSATKVSGFFPHTDRVDWEVGMDSAVLKGRIVGVSSEVMGDVGFVVSDSVYDKPDRTNGKILVAKGGLQEDMTFSCTVKDLKKKYYFVRAILLSYKDDNGKRDTLITYAPEVKIFHPLDTIDLGLSVKWANLNVGGQFPEEFTDKYAWNDRPDSTLSDVVSDIGGTIWDRTFNQWRGRQGWTFTLPTAAQMQAVLDSCTFEEGRRFDRDVVKITGPNGNCIYVPYYTSRDYSFSPHWTSERQWGSEMALRGDFLDKDHLVTAVKATAMLWMRPVYQVNATMKDKTQLFISTDTVGLSADHSHVALYGRVLGITEKIKAGNNVVRGFVLNDFYGGTLANGSNIADTASTKAEYFNGLYIDNIPKEVIDTMSSYKTYWYRAYIKVGDEVFYGKPKKIVPLTVGIDDIDWEVHENTATLHSSVVGTVFIKDRTTAKTGFITGKTADIDIDHNVSNLPYTFPEGKQIADGNYTAAMPVAKDTVYWVRAYVIADNKTIYSTPRQFGLDYVDLGLASGRLWANISVGSTYPEDKSDFFSIGEGFLKNHHDEDSYIDDYIKGYKENGETFLTTKTMIEELNVKSTNGTDYKVPYHGAVKKMMDCSNSIYWKHYSGTKNDGAYVFWENANQKFQDNSRYISPDKYGDLFVEPNYDEWKELVDSCTWTRQTENGIGGYKVTGKNGNSIFLPYNGYRLWNNTKGIEELINDGEAGYYQVADTTMLMTVAGRDFTYGILKPAGPAQPWYELTYSQFYGGHNIRPIARYNLRLTKDKAKLSDNTLVYLTTDTATYINYRTAVALQGTYRINYPIANGSYDLGFVVGDDANITYDNCKIHSEYKTRDGSQYFVVLDKDNNLVSDKTYYYRFYLHTGDEYYYADADTFHLGRTVTGNADWTIHKSTATLHGTIEGVMPTEASSDYKAGIIVGYDRNLTYDNKIEELNCADTLKSPVGPVAPVFTLTKDTTYYFRAYAYYNNKYHYGDVNLFGNEFVDLGLPSGKRWASTNVGGASALYGIDTTPLRQKMTYNVDSIIRGPGSYDDAAHREWHNVSRMPMTAEMQELIDNCTWTADTIYGAAGVRVTGPNGKSIFLRHTHWYGPYEKSDYYSLSYDYMKLPKNNDADPKKHKGEIVKVPLLRHDCFDIDLLRPIHESNIRLANGDELLIRTDGAQVHDSVNNVTFFGSLLGTTQQHLGTEPYKVPDVRQSGFIVGTDSLVTRDAQTFRYEFPRQDITTDTIFFYNKVNINLFKVDSTYWVRAYVDIAGTRYYGRSIPFVRQPNIITGDVKWNVGDSTAVLYGAVYGFNKETMLEDDTNVTGEMKDIQDLAKNARIGMIVGYVKDITADSPKEAIDSIYDLGPAWNGEFNITMKYDKDTTYYYRAFIKYNGHYVYSKYVNHFGLEFVDLGMPMQWANINVGSRYAEDNSSQLAWGEAEKKDAYTFANYAYYNAAGDDEYNNLGNEIKGSKADVAHTKWNYTWDEKSYGGRGALWTMPSMEDLQMLVDSCTWTDSIAYGNASIKGNKAVAPVAVKGYKVTGKNGRSIFISNERYAEWTMSGYHTYYDGPWEYGPLWSSSRAPRERNAYGMEIGLSNRLMKYHYRYHGHLVRPMAYVNVTLPSGKKLSITTERCSWVAGKSSSTLYGCVLGINGIKASYGFVVGTSAKSLEVGRSGVQKYACGSTASGLFSYTMNDLSSDRMYYYRAYVSVDGRYYYGRTQSFGIVMVDLGLPSGTKWANVNLGSWKSHEHGDFFSWGETATKDVFQLSSYKYYNTITGNYRSLAGNITANDTVDAANKQLGGLWRMPSEEDWTELLQNCTVSEETISHVPGYRITSKQNGNSIFLPSNYYNANEEDANYYQGTNEEATNNHDDEATHFGYYWTSNRSGDYRQAREIEFQNTYSGNNASTQKTPVLADNSRYRGDAIRAVASVNKADKFYLRTVGTDWRMDKDSVNFYYTALNLPKGYTTGILIGKGTALTLGAEGVKEVASKQNAQGSTLFDAPVYDGTSYNDTVYHYCAYATDGTTTVYGEVKEFGLTGVDLGTGSLRWANINVDAASPEEYGLNGTLTGKYASCDPAYAEFKGQWHIPTEDERKALVDDCNWESAVYEGVHLWKVSNKADATKFIYLTSKDPNAWGYRAVSQFTGTINGKTYFLRTDSTDWRAGYENGHLYATLINDAALNDAEKGFILAKTDNPDATTDGAETVKASATDATSFSAKLPELENTTYYYRAYIKAGDTYYYAPETKTVGLELIDLGLPSGLRWASVNIGSHEPQQTGDLYAWGDTIPGSSFSASNYRYYSSKGYTDIGNDISGNDNYDVAAKRINGLRMPTADEVKELLTSCTWTEETVDGADAYRVTSKTNGNSIIIPKGALWSSTQLQSDNSEAYAMNYKSSAKGALTEMRYRGLMIRPVASEITTLTAYPVSTDNATLNGLVGSGKATEVGFELSMSSTMENATTITATASNGKFSAQASGLSQGSIYYFRAYAKTGSETRYGSIRRFATESVKQNEPIAVDLGLSVKWGDRNVGATTAEEVGNYYAWGELKTTPNFTKITYTYNVNDKYSDIGTEISATDYDVASRKYNGCWRMPTSAEVTELMNNCTWTWASKNGVPGYWVENKTSHQTIFLPAAGYRKITDLHDNATAGNYWSASAKDAVNGFATSLNFMSSGRNLKDYTTRFYGLTIRPVYQSNSKLGSLDTYVHTDGISYKDDRSANTLSGTMLGMTSAEDKFTEGFVIGTTEDVEIGTTVIGGISRTATENGAYSIVVDSKRLKTLYAGGRYYVRAYISDGTHYSYGNAIEMTDNTTTTDSVKWALGNSGTFYGSIHAKKTEGLEVGFLYSQNADMTDAKSVKGTFLSDADSVFTASIDTVKVGIYYLRAYTKLNGIVHTANIIHFGAQAVDLGLTSGVKWVDMNLGSDNEESTGDSYRWGETAPYDKSKSYSVPSNYQYIGGTDLDAAHTRLGNKYRLPSTANVQELIDECTWIWDVNGYRITGKNGNSIFLPTGSYWSTQQNSKTADTATSLVVEPTNHTLNDEEKRTDALLLRPILNPSADTSGGAQAGTGEIGGGVEGNE